MTGEEADGLDHATVVFAVTVTDWALPAVHAGDDKTVVNVVEDTAEEYRPSTYKKYLRQQKEKSVNSKKN